MEDIKQALRNIVEALELLKSRVDEINLTLEKQGLRQMPPGHVVEKQYCRDTHGELVEVVCSKADKIDQTVTSKLKWSWLIFTFIMGGQGALILYILSKVH